MFQGKAVSAGVWVGSFVLLRARLRPKRVRQSNSELLSSRYCHVLWSGTVGAERSAVARRSGSGKPGSVERRITWGGWSPGLRPVYPACRFRWFRNVAAKARGRLAVVTGLFVVPRFGPGMATIMRTVERVGSHPSERSDGITGAVSLSLHVLNRSPSGARMHRGRIGALSLLSPPRARPRLEYTPGLDLTLLKSTYNII